MFATTEISSAQLNSQRTVKYIFSARSSTDFQERSLTMSMVIDIDNLPHFTAIFEEIERRSRENRENRPRVFTAVEANTAKIHKTLRKTTSLAVTQRESTKRSTFGRRASDPASSSSVRVIEPRVRIRCAPCPLIDPAKLQDEPRLTEAAKKLSNEELALLYEDILKPLDFYLILHERRGECEDLNL